MLKTRVIPCLSLKDDGLVKTIRFKKPTYIGDPINAVKIFNDKEVDELVFIDITASKEGKPINFKLLSEISSECFMPLAYGGGIRNLHDIERLFNLGIEKVILNSCLKDNFQLVTEAAKKFGSQSIVVSIDVKKHWLTKKQTVHTHSGQENTGITPEEFAIAAETAGAGEIILNSIDNDGMMQGYDTELISCVSKKVNVPVVALGGAGSLTDFTKAIESGASAVAAGSFFVFQKTLRAVLITYPSQKELTNLFPL